jgi:creatinine deaminase
MIDNATLTLIALTPTERLDKLPPLKDEDFMRIATLLAQKSYDEGGCPIGAVIVDDASKQIIGKGHNMLVQENDSTTHGETAALRDAGRISKLRGHGPVDFRHTTIYTTLTPCLVCCAQITQRAHFSRVVIGDVTNAPSTESILRTGGIQNITILEDPQAVSLYKAYAEKRPDLHFIDWVGHQKWDESRH